MRGVGQVNMSLLTVSGASRLAMNAKFLAVRLIGIVIHFVPFKVTLLNGLGIVTGLFFMFLRTGQWRAIKRFARYTGSTLPTLLYILKYFVQQGKDGVWGYVFCEAPSVLDKYVTMQNLEAMKQALARGKGAIVLGAHYGPVLCTYMLDRMHFNVKTLVDKRFVTQLHNAGTLVLKPLRSKKILFLNESGVVLVSREEEKYLFDHVKKGGMAKMDIDYPGPRRNAGTAPFLGISISPHLFPFRLALKYDIPIFFCFFNKNKCGAYIMNFIPSVDYSTPEEGFRRYLSRLQAQIEEYPFMWGMIPLFFEWS
jgi:lauroyl/myristoyl acyltransferase